MSDERHMIETWRIGPPGDEACQARATCALSALSDPHPSMIVARHQAVGRLEAAHGGSISIHSALARLADDLHVQIRESARMLDLREAQLADCTRVMRKVATEIVEAIRDADEDGHVYNMAGDYVHQIEIFEWCAKQLDAVRAGKAGA